MEAPPGVLFIISNAPHIALPPAIALCTIQLWGSFSSVCIPIWFQLLLYAASFPLALACDATYRDFRDKRQAARNGATLALRVPSKLPGALDLMYTCLKNLRKGYMGDEVGLLCKDNRNTIMLRFLWGDRILTMEPQHVKTLLATQFKSFVKGPIFYDAAFSLLGTGVFNADGDVWKLHRSMLRPFFSKDRISDFEVFERHADDAIGQLKARLKQGHPVDFQDMVSRFTLDSATEFLFGKDVCSLAAGLVYPPNLPLAINVAIQNHPANRFAHAFLEAQVVTAHRVRFGKSWRLFEFWSDQLKRNMRICHEFINPILEDALSKKKALKEAGLITEKTRKEREVLEGETLLDHLVHCTEDVAVIKDEILNIMIAGRDTTAGTLTCMIWMLSQHPNILRKLRGEVLSVVGNSRSPTSENFREMKYMKAVINETLRLYPPVPFNARTSVEATVLPAVAGGQPIYVPANAIVQYSPFLMHRRKDLWGPDADEFDPDRFLDERLHTYLTSNPFIFVPFNAGPRICPGQQFAYNEISYFVVRLLQVFSSISLAEDAQTLAPAEWANAPGRKGVEKAIIRYHLTTYVKDGLWVRMTEDAQCDPLSC